MSNLTHLVGTYNKVGNFLIHKDHQIKLLITSRVNVTTKKAVNFLLDKTENKGKYISSIYHVSTITDIDTYNFDYQGVKYIMTQCKQGGETTIKQRQNTESYSIIS